MITRNKVRLCPKRLSDAVDDYAWQTDLELTRLDASSPLTMDFTQYLLRYADELYRFRRLKHQFAIDTPEGEHIGNCAYYGIDDKRGEAEIGIMIGDRNYREKGYGTAAVTALVDHIFLETGLRRIHLKTLDDNERARRCFSRCGFTICGELIKNGHSFVLMEMYRHQWQRERDKVSLAESR